MLALLLLLIATACGVVLAARLTVALGAWARLSVGVALGQLGLLWVPFLLAAAFDLGAREAALAATCALGAGLAAAVFAWRVAAVGFVQALRLTGRQRAPALGFGVLLALLGWLHHTHYLLPRGDALYSAGVTWGDLPMHLGLATRFLYAEGLPPLEHPLALHGSLSYPFLPDYSVAVLAAGGLPLRWAFIVGGMLPLAALPLSIHGLCRLWLDRPGALHSVLAIVLFLLAGGLGFGVIGARLLDGASPGELLATTNATDLSPHILKTGHVGNLFLAARTAAYGMPLGAAAILLLGHLVEGEGPGSRLTAGVAGLLAGSLPLVHSHSFLVVGGALAWHVLLDPRLRARWLACLAPFALAALPQMLYLLHAGSRGFVRLGPGLLRPAPGVAAWLLDVVLSLGVWLLLLPFALRAAPPRARRLAAPLLLWLPIACVATFTPERYDNVKLLAWFDVAAAVLVAGLLARLLRARRGERAFRARIAAGWLALVGCTLSGALAVGHELYNRGLLVGREDLRLAQLVIANTPASAVVATAATYHDPVAMLTGRRVVIAAPYMLQTHGFDVAARARDVVSIYAGGSAAREAIDRLGVSAVVVGPHERRDLPRIDERFLAGEARAVHRAGHSTLYLLRSRGDVAMSGANVR